MANSLIATSESSSTEADIARFLQPNQWPEHDGYQPLDKDKSEIRVLRAFFAKSSDVLCITTSHISLVASPPPTYTAISYCWGPPDRLVPLWINEQQVLIRASLHCLISTLCAKDQTESFWLDSLCINQRDVLERNWQVRLMGEIYSKAALVHVWLGEANVYSDFLFSYMKHSDVLRFDAGRTKPMKKHLANGVAELASRPYWSRMWIVQEFVQANILVIWSGSQHCSWESLYSSFEYFGYTHAQSAPWQKLEKLRRALRGLGNAAMLDENLWMFNLVLDWNSSDCQDARDRVYSLVNVARNGFDAVIDYRLSPFDVWMQLCVAAQNNIGICMQADSRHSSSNARPGLRAAADSFERVVGIDEYWSVLLMMMKLVADADDPIDFVDHSQIDSIRLNLFTIPKAIFPRAGFLLHKSSASQLRANGEGFAIATFLEQSREDFLFIASTEPHRKLKRGDIGFTLSNAGSSLSPCVMLVVTFNSCRSTPLRFIGILIENTRGLSHSNDIAAHLLIRGIELCYAYEYIQVLDYDDDLLWPDGRLPVLNIHMSLLVWLFQIALYSIGSKEDAFDHDYTNLTDKWNSKVQTMPVKNMCKCASPTPEARKEYRHLFAGLAVEADS